MSKKAKTHNEVKSTPEFYVNLNREPARLKTCIIEDVHGGFYRFDTPQACHILKQAIHKCWATHDDFHKEAPATILTYHANLFGAEPPKDQDLVTTSVLTYYKLCDLAVDRTITTPKTTTGRVAKILNSVYTEGETVEGYANLKTPQALKCVDIFRDAIRAKQDADVKTAEDSKVALPANYEAKLSEEELRKTVEVRATELHTRQDPWRIFQYYRSNLIAAKILRRQ